MAAKKKPLDTLTVAAIALISAALLYFVYIFLMGFKAPATSFNYSLGQFKQVGSSTVGSLKSLNACGDWPISPANLSQDRGNPFSRQPQATAQMAATSSVICIPVTQ